MTARVQGALAVALLLAIGCSGDGGAPPEVRHPALAGADAAAREQILAARAVLDDGGGDAAVRAAAFGHLGMLYQTYAMSLAAEDAYRNAEYLAPTEPAWPYYRALVHRDRGEHADALAAFDRALTVDPGDVPSLVRTGRVALEIGRVERAEAAFRQALDRDPACAAAFLGLGKVAIAREEPEAAIGWFEAALAADPAATELHYLLGQAWRSLGDDERALAYLERPHDGPVRLDDPREVALRDLRVGIVAAQQRADRLAARGASGSGPAALRQAVAERPDEPRLRVNLAEVLIREGDLAAAEAELVAALGLEPDYATAHYNLGVVLDRTGRRAAAVASYRRTLELDPARVAARWNLALDLRRLGRFDEALAELRTVVERDPARAEAGLVEALTLVRLGRWRDARQRLEAAHRAFPEDPGIRQALLRLLAAAPDATVRDGIRAVRLAAPLARPGMPADVAETLAMVAAETGDFPTAVQLQEQLVRAAGPGVPAVIREALGRNLSRYRAGQPCREPWPLDHPVLTPPLQ